MGFSYMPSNPDSQGVSFCHENFPQDIYNVYLALEFLEKEIASKKGIVGNEIPKVFFNGEKPTDKTNVNAKIEYISETLQFKGYVDIKCQGTSSMAYPKKNYTIKLYKDEQKEKKMKVEMKDWGEQSKFCLKANYIDHSHARNICSARLWDQMVSSRENYEELPELLRTSPRNGAVDGFPIKVYYNNNYEGIYTWNIPKDKWMFNMDDKLEDHCVLCGEEYNSGCFLSANASAWSDEIHDVMPETIKRSFEDFQRFVINSSDDEFKANLERYVFVDSLIDYYIFQYVICGLDSMGKNQLFVTYDGLKWIASAYDMDSTFGLYWNGQSFVSAEYRMQEDYESGLNTSNINNSKGNVLYYRLEQLFPNEIKARYMKVRSEVLSYSNIVNEFEKFTNIIPKDLYDEDLTIYTEIPSGESNNIIQIRNYIRDRLIYVDTKIEELGASIPCTSISLNKAEITLGKVINNDGEPINYLDNINSGNHYNDLYFDRIILEPGTYEFKNINGGTFTWLGYRIDNVQAPQVDSTESVTLNLSTYSLVQFHAYANNNDNNTYDKLAVYKIVDGNYSSEGMVFNTQLTPIVEPSNTTDKIIWSNSSDDVVAIDNGKLTANSNGESIITVTCGDQSAICNVTVRDLNINNEISYILPEETVFNGTSDYIDTEVALCNSFNKDKEFTLLLDFTVNAYDSEHNSSIFHCMTESEPYPGTCFDINKGNFRLVIPNGKDIDLGGANLNRTKYVIIKSHDTMAVYNENMELLHSEILTGEINTSEKTLLLGAYQNNNGEKGRYFNGTIHKFEIREGVMSNDDCLNWMRTV